MEEAKFTYSRLGKAFEKQARKTSKKIKQKNKSKQLKSMENSQLNLAMKKSL